MSVDLKPGLKTKLNSNNNIRDKFSNHKDGKTHGVKNSAGSSASSNLHGMSRTSADWSSKNESIMGGRHNPGAGHNPGVGHNPGSHVRKQSFNFVSSGWGAKKAAASDIKTRMTTGSLDLTPLWGRGAFTGTTRRALQREFNNNYGRLNDYWDKGGLSTGEKIAAGVTLATAAGSLVAGIVDAFTGSKTPTNSVNTGSGGTAAGSSVTSATSNAINLMKSASNSSELQSAINVAKNELGGIDEEIDEKTKDLEEANEKAESLQTTYLDAKNKYDEVNKEIETKNQEVKTLGQEVQSCETAFKSAQDTYQKADKAVITQEKKVSQLKMKLNRATSDNGDTTKIQKELNAAEVKQKELEQERDTAEGIKNARENLKNAAEEKYGEAQSAFEEMKQEKLEPAKQKMDEALKAHTDNLKIINTADSEIKSLRKTKENLEDSIPKYSKKLVKMKAKEEEESQKTAGKEEKYNDKSAEKLEQGKDKKSAKAEKKAANYSNKQISLQKIAAIRDLPVNTDDSGGYFGGHEFKCGDVNGEMLYAVDGIEVTEDEYNTQLAAAKGQ